MHLHQAQGRLSLVLVVQLVLRLCNRFTMYYLRAQSAVTNLKDVPFTGFLRSLSTLRDAYYNRHTLLSCVIFQRKQRIPDSCLRLPQHQRLYGNSSSISQLILYVRRKCNKRENLKTQGIMGRMQKHKGYRAP